MIVNVELDGDIYAELRSIFGRILHNSEGGGHMIQVASADGLTQRMDVHCIHSCKQGYKLYSQCIVICFMLFSFDNRQRGRELYRMVCALTF